MASLRGGVCRASGSCWTRDAGCSKQSFHCCAGAAALPAELGASVDGTIDGAGGGSRAQDIARQLCADEEGHSQHCDLAGALEPLGAGDCINSCCGKGHAVACSPLGANFLVNGMRVYPSGTTRHNLLAYVQHPQARRWQWLLPVQRKNCEALTLNGIDTMSVAEMSPYAECLYHNTGFYERHPATWWHYHSQLVS
mmetsp:Transcript_36158/g.81841  ORF Transcript_36158/g.81841 Transcript_36158/m.81841 type:complete len:196 (+) Transcript_36158:1288-1875(+)